MISSFKKVSIRNISSGRPRTFDGSVGALRPAPFARFSDRIMEYMATTFSPMYARVFRQYWHNSVFSRMKKNYYSSNFMESRGEIWIPTIMSLEQNMKFYRIAWVIVAKGDREDFKEKVKQLRHDRRVSHPRAYNKGGAAGKMDSETLIYIWKEGSPRNKARWRQDKKRVREGLKPKEEWILRDYYLTTPGIVPKIRACPFWAETPEIAVMNILKVITGFIEDRIKAMIGSFHLKSKLSSWRGSLTSTLLYITNLIEKRGLGAIANGLRCMTHTLNWLRQKRRQIIAHLAQQTHIMSLIHKIKPFQPLLERIRANHNPYQLEPKSPLIKTLLQLCYVAKGPPF